MVVSVLQTKIAIGLLIIVSHSMLLLIMTFSLPISDFGNVRIGNSGVSKIVGIEDICLETSIRNKIVLKDVINVPNIRLNLISTSRLEDKGFTILLVKVNGNSPKAF